MLYFAFVVVDDDNVVVDDTGKVTHMFSVFVGDSFSKTLNLNLYCCLQSMKKNVRAQKGCKFFLSDIPNPPKEKQSCHSLQGEGACKRDFGISKTRGTPQNGCLYIMENPVKMGWFGGKTHYFWKHPFDMLKCNLLCMHSHKPKNTVLLTAFFSPNHRVMNATKTTPKAPTQTNNWA